MSRVWRVLFPCDCPLGIKIGEEKGGVTAVSGFHKLPMRIRHGEEVSIDLPLEDDTDITGSDIIEDVFVEGPGRACGVIKRGNVIIRVNNDSCIGMSHEEIKRKVAYLKNMTGADTLAITFSSKKMAKMLASGTLQDEADAVGAATEVDSRTPFSQSRANVIVNRRKRWSLRKSKQRNSSKLQPRAPSANQSQLNMTPSRSDPTFTNNRNRTSNQDILPTKKNKNIIKKPLIEQFYDSIGGWPRKSGAKEKVGNVDIENLRKLAFYGVPDATGLRSTVWRLLLDYLPRDVDSWQKTLSSKRSLYKEWREDLYPKDARRRHSIGDKLGVGLREGYHGTNHSNPDDNNNDKSDADASMPDPLSPSLDAHWSEHWKESALLGEIWKDVKRTNTQYSFFSRERDPSIADALERLLFLFAKLNPGVRYVQGMNEVLAPILYCFYTDVPKDSEKDILGYLDRDNLEADVFFCFQRVMSYMTDVFVEELDEAECGIDGTLEQLDRCLKAQDNEVYLHLRGLGLNPKFYAMRWLTTLLAREFDMPDTIRLWDALFADSKRFDFLIVVCVAIITTQRDHLLKCDFATAIQLLQRPYSLGIERLLGQATQAYRESDRGGLDLPDGVERGNNSKREIAGIHAEEVEKALKKVAAASQETASRLLGKLRTWASAEKKPKSLTRMSPIRKTKKDDIMENHPAKGLGARDMAKAETLVTEKETALTSIDVRGTQSHLKPSSSHEFIEPTNLFANAEDDCDLFDSD